jgi:hypothetical protein
MEIAELFKKIIHRMVPLCAYEYLVRKWRGILPPIVKRSSKANLRFKNIHAGERCFILASGPSINMQDLTPLANEVCFSVGQFFHHPLAGTIKPIYHIEAPMHQPFKHDTVENLFNRLSAVYKHSPTLFLGHLFYKYSFYEYIRQTTEQINSLTNFINYENAPQLSEKNYQNEDLWDITKTPFVTRTVVYSAIQVAAYMGFSKIYLLGCDHDYLKRHFLQTFESSHFYAENNSVLGDDGTKYLDSFTLENWFKEYYYRWKQYRLMNQFLSKRGQFVYNATEGGMLDVFQRVRFCDII